MYYYLLSIGKGIYVSENWANHIVHPGGVASMRSELQIVIDGDNIYRDLYRVTKDDRLKKYVRLCALSRLISIDKTESKFRLFLVALSVSQSFHDVKMSCIVFVKVVLRRVKEIFVKK